MEASEITDLIGYFAGICLAVSFLPQVIKTWRTKNAEDVSMWMLVVTLISGIGYEIYAWRLGLMPVVIMNGVFITLVASVAVLKLIYASPKTPRERSISQ